MQLSFMHLLIVVVLIVFLFGRGRISDMMGDLASGIKNFKKGLRDDDIEPKAIDRSAEEKPYIRADETEAEDKKRVS